MARAARLLLVVIGLALVSAPAPPAQVTLTVTAGGTGVLPWQFCAGIDAAALDGAGGVGRAGLGFGDVGRRMLLCRIVRLVPMLSFASAQALRVRQSLRQVPVGKRVRAQGP